MVIGDQFDGSSKAVVTGAGSVLNVGALAIGLSCGCNYIGTLTIADGAVVNAFGTSAARSTSAPAGLPEQS
jgi:T5SS/PEP-CTERM-associated repeat protein